MLGSKQTVPLDLYTDLLAKYHEAVLAIATMRQQGFAPVREAKIAPAKPEPETQAVQRAEDQFVTTMAKHIQIMSGASELDARAEAEKIRRQTLDPFTQVS